ncbi:MAG: BACON domain-containing protein [Paenibacillus sp.]|nr:BACON domain-containing protein [Paenibacillus sp.]
MKKIYNILLAFMLIGPSFTSCDNDDEIVSVMPAKVTILSRETSFPASASSGKIVVDTDAPVSVSTSDTGWVTTSVDGNVITVNVEANTSYDGRSSTLTITSGDASSQIAIIQAGVIVDLHGVINILTGNDEANYSYDVKTNVEPEISTDAEWIKASLVDGKLNIKIEANNTGHFRKGTVTFKAGEYESTLPITQVDFDQDIAGDDYMFAFVNTSTGKINYFDAEVGRTGSSYWIKIPALDFSIPVTFDSKEVSLSLAAGNYIGDYQNMYIHTVMWDMDEGYLTWSSSVSITANYVYYPEEGTDDYCILEADFEDNGSWGGYVVNCLRLEAFSSKSISSSTRKGSILNMAYPFLQKVHPHAVAPAMLRARSASRSASPMPKLMPFEIGSLSVLKDDSNVKVAN